MAITIDQLNIELTADSQKASSAIENLAKTLEGLKSSLGPLANVNVSVSNSFNTLTKSINGATNSTSTSKNAFEKLSSDAKELGYRIIAVSTYRDYNYQENLYTANQH